MTRSHAFAAAVVLGLAVHVSCAGPRPPSLGAAGENPAGSSLELRNGRWLGDDGFSAPRTMYAVDGRLTASRPARVGTVLDLAGGYVVPPFAEGHNHWLEPGAIDAYDAMYLREGVFYLKDQANASVIRRRLDAALNGPATVDFVSANEGWTGPGGHPMQIAMQFLQFGSFPAGWTENDLDRNVVNEVDGVSAVDSRWPDFLAGRPDFVKVFLLYSEEYEKRKADPAFRFHRGIDPALVPEIVKRAHAAGLRVSAHVYSAADFHNALAGGVDDVAHMPGTGYEEKMGAAAFRISEADARLAAARGVTVMTTLSWLGEQMGEDAAAGRAVLENVIRPNVAILRRFGVSILVGSDQFRQSSAPEAMLLSRLGLFSNAELLKMWCEATPRAIFPSRRIGRLAEGFEASLLVLERNPLEDFAATGEISLRVKRGIVLPAPPTLPFPQLGTP